MTILISNTHASFYADFPIIFDYILYLVGYLWDFAQIKKSSGTSNMCGVKMLNIFIPELTVCFPSPLLVDAHPQKNVRLRGVKGNRQQPLSWELSQSLIL